MSAPDLIQIASDLESLEETIIVRLIDRAQYRRNETVYIPGKSGFRGEPVLSLFALRLKYQEEMDARFGRFHVPEERPFNRDLPEVRREVTLPENCLHVPDYNLVNVTDGIINSYLRLLPKICRTGDDSQYGSSVENDVYAIQAISRRIHYGAMYVAESKYRTNPDAYQRAIDNGDRATLLTLLTRPEVERQILQRVADKTISMQASSKATIRHAIDAAVIRDYYAAHVIPLTKEGEIRYLMHRR
ncbi:MAG: chorismate mutase [Pseudomonadota bacterium]